MAPKRRSATAQEDAKAGATQSLQGSGPLQTLPGFALAASGPGQMGASSSSVGGAMAVMSTKQEHRDHELFLQAYEKPTQIYRFLRTRFMLSPIFLTRTLQYMRQRLSRSNRTRENFKVDSLLDKMLQKNRNEIQPHPVGDYLTLTFLGYYDPSLERSENLGIRVETSLLKICHKRRKDSSSAVAEVSVGSTPVHLNPSSSDPPTTVPALSLSSESFGPSQGSDVKSYALLLRVAVCGDSTRTCDGDAEESVVKKFKSEERRLGSELVIYDRHNRCLIKTGEYDLSVREMPFAPTVRSPRKSFSAHWETVGEDVVVPNGGNPFDDFKSKPTIKLILSWSQEPIDGYVSRPTPFRKSDGSAMKTENNNYNKENNRPLVNGSKTRKNNDSAKVNGVHKSDKTEPKMLIIYQFLYLNNSRQQTEASDDLSCPWCSLDCGRLYSLLKHLKLCHSRFSFAYYPLTNGARIDVSLNELYDGSFAGSPHEAAGLPIKSGATRRRVPLTHILVFRPHNRRMHRPQPSNLLEFAESDENEMAESQRPYISGHNRLYHHTITCLPVYPKELEVDSEGETDPLWLQQKTMMMIDEFTDVNEGEKELMKMWNLHIMKYNFVGDCQIPIACQMFLQNKGKELLQKNLYRNFVLHMCSLHDFGLISPIVLYQTMQLLNQILAENPDIKQKLKENIGVQREHWTTIGMHQQPTFVEQKNVQNPNKSAAFNGDSSPAIRRKTPNVQNSSRSQSSNFKSQQNNCNIKSENSNNNEVNQKRNSFQLPVLNVNSKNSSTNGNQMPLRRKSAGGNPAAINHGRKRLSLQDRKNST